MSPVDWLRRTFGSLSVGNWGSDCPVHHPIPHAGACSAVGCDSVPLTVLRQGQRAVVTCLDDPGGPAARRLAAMGVLPGAEITLTQHWPVFVFRLGPSELAVDASLAAGMRVRRTGQERDS